MANIITDEKMFPYWSHAFNCEVRSRSHKKALERHHGVTPVTSTDLDASAKAIRERNIRTDKKIADEDDRYEHSPHYARYRELRARGMFTKHLPKGRQERAQKGMMKRADDVRSRRKK